MTTDTASQSRRHPADRNVLFWAERDPAFYVGITGLSSLLIAPLILLAPGMFVFGLLFLGLSNLVAAQFFRFEVTAGEVRWRNSFWWPTLRIPLADVADVAWQPQGGWLFPTRGRMGVLTLKLAAGGRLYVPGLRDPEEAADAVRRLARQAREGLPAGAAGPAAA